MKKIGVLGGMTFESSVDYYYRINKQVNREAGGMNCAEMILYNVNFEDIFSHMRVEDWEPIYRTLLDASKKLEAAGAEFLVIATNTMHRFYDRLQPELGIPILHIADCVADAIKAKGISKVALLGTKFTMQQDFLKDRLKKNGIEAVVPDTEADMDEIHRVIIEELTFHEIKDASRAFYKSVVDHLAAQYGVEGAILGCTEIELLIKEGDFSVPVFDTTQEHINGAVKAILS